jgi:hypothetical protein
VDLNKPQQLEQAKRILLIIFLALLAGQGIFLGVVSFLHSRGFQTYAAPGDVLLIVAALLTVAGPARLRPEEFGASRSGGSAAGFFLYVNRVQAISQYTDSNSRWRVYLSAVILRLAMLEAASTANIGFYLLTGDYTFLVFVTLLLVLFVVARPTSESFEENVLKNRFS